jgi:ParB family chromosome partitioning protein
MSKRSGLGKGLEALIPTTDSQLPESGVTLIPIAHLSPNPRQPRARFDQEELAELAASIREHGVIQPLVVTQGESEDRYTVIAGERRLMAAEMVELKAVPVIIREASDQQFVELALVENVQRADLGPLETAEAYRQLSEDFGLSHEEIATRVGKSRVTITNTLRLLNLPEEVKKALAEGDISEGHARALLALPTSEAQILALGSILKLDLNVRQTEELIRKLSGKRPEKKPPTSRSPEIEALEQRLREYLGTRVTLKQRSKGGILTIHYYSEEELNSLLNLILDESI